MYRYYEEGKERIISNRKAYRMFAVMVDDNQKGQGTTFESWLSEMEKLQIFVKM